MRFFTPAAILAACSTLAAAVPTASIGNTTDVAFGGGITCGVHTQCTDTIILGLGHNGLNVGASETLYHDVTTALTKLCPVSDNYCISKPATFPVWITAPSTKNPYQRVSVRKTISVTVIDAKWDGLPDVYTLMRSTIAAAFERGTFDPKNCYEDRVPGDKEDHYKDCMTMDYAEVVLSGGYKMKVRFGGPPSSLKKLRYDCGVVVDDAFAFLRDDLPWKAGTNWVYCLEG